MIRRPRSLTLVGWLFIAVGCFSMIGEVLSLIDAAASSDARRPFESALAWIIHAIAVVSGAGILYGFGAARWLLLVWMGYHLVPSVFHPPFEVVAHGVIFAPLLYILFRAAASAYFRGRKAGHTYIPAPGDSRHA